MSFVFAKNCSKMQPMRRLIVLTWAFWLLSAPSFGQSSSPWRFVELKMPADSFWGAANSVDRFRNVYGYFYKTGPQIPRAVRWMAATNWTPEVLDDQAQMIGASANSTVVGIRWTSTWPYNDAVMWNPEGTLSVLGGLPAHVSANASSINKSSTVCGFYLDSAGGSYHAFSWLNGVATEIPAFGTLQHAFGRSINDAGFVVGHASDSTTQPTKSSSWIWTKTGSIQELPRLSTFSEAVDINNTGLIAGWYRASGYAKAIVWPIFGPPQELGTIPGSDNAQTSAVTDSGLVVGTAWTGKWNRQSNVRAVAWSGPDKYDLTSLFSIDGMTLFSATDANFRDDIVGYGSIAGRSIGFLLIKKTN
jgi:uncharacterized membrane protein